MSKLIDIASNPGTKSELDLFNIPPTQVAVVRNQWKEIQAANAIDSEGPYEFHIAPNPQMLQLSKNYLYMELRVLKEDGTQADEIVNNVVKVSLINMIGSTFVKQVKLSINGSEIFDSGDKYAYRAMMETELCHGKDAKSSQLQAALYFADTYNKIDDATNEAIKWRALLCDNSKWVQVMAPIHADLFSTNRYMLSHTDIRMQVYRNSDAFCLMRFDTENYKIEVGSMRWYVKTVDIQPSIGLALEKTLLHHTAKYPVRRVVIKTLHIDAGRKEAPQTPIFNGQIPRRLVIGCVSYASYIGSYAHSPFNFKHFQMNELSIVVGGESVPFKPLTMNFLGNQYMRAFTQLFEGLGIAGEDKGNGIDMHKFASGSTLFAFDLSPDEDDGGHWDLVKEGATCINMKFGAAVPAGGIEVIAYGEFDNLLTIDRNRNPYTDYKA